MSMNPKMEQDMENRHTEIERYLNNKMLPSERSEFEQEIRKDATLRAEVMEQKKAYLLINSEKNKDFVNSFLSPVIKEEEAKYQKELEEDKNNQNPNPNGSLINLPKSSDKEGVNPEIDDTKPKQEA